MPMRFVVESTKSVQQALEDLQETVKKYQFGVLHVHDLQGTLKSKGYDLSHVCYVVDICNPRQALQVLTEDLGMSVALPCSISVYEQGGHTKLAMIKPSAMLTMLSQSPSLAGVAEEVEATLVKIINEAK